MEARNLGYSMKNTPIPPKQRYLKSMMEKVENFITRLRWKVHFFGKKEHSVDMVIASWYMFNMLIAI